MKETLSLILIGLALYWVASLIPDAEWMYDRKPVCPEDKPKITFVDQRMVCEPWDAQ